MNSTSQAELKQIGVDCLGHPYYAELNVPAKYYDEALAFCNARRAEKELEPIARLPAGVREDINSCPCANSVPGQRLSVENFAWGWGDIDGLVGSERDKILCNRDIPGDFIDYFDMHAESNIITLPIRDGVAA